MLIDFHTHIFPDSVAPNAIQKLSLNAGGARSFYNGTKKGLIGFMDENGLDLAVVLSVATNPSQQKSVNDFAASVNGGRLISFGSVHPDAPDALSEIDRISDMGLYGIKLHPDYQQFYGDDKKMTPIYEKIAKKGMTVVFHCGVDIGLYPPVHMTPAYLAKALKPLEGATVVAAHFGGYMMWEQALDSLCGKEIYLDTAYAMGKIPPNLAAQIIRAHGAERILFGSDLPWSHAGDEVQLIRSLGLSKNDLEKIFYLNAKKILKI